MSKEETADEALRIQLKMARDLKAPFSDPNATANQVTARNVLHDELGRFSDIQREYDIDDATRDRLIVHTRHDAAHALLNTITLMKEVRRINQRARNTRIAIAVLSAGALVLWIWWPR
ncbi:MAG: hypothetical protein NTZ72_13270 [Afipia sp.]|nr:hypothetical protein [Afipia sp.]